MISSKKAQAIGRILILARELDTLRGEYSKLQKILGAKVYFQKAGKWYYDVKKMSKKSIPELNRLSVKIKNEIK